MSLWKMKEKMIVELLSQTFEQITKKIQTKLVINYN